MSDMSGLQSQPEPPGPRCPAGGTRFSNVAGGAFVVTVCNPNSNGAAPSSSAASWGASNVVVAPGATSNTATTATTGNTAVGNATTASEADPPRGWGRSGWYWRDGNFYDHSHYRRYYRGSPYWGDWEKHHFPDGRRYWRYRW